MPYYFSLKIKQGNHDPNSKILMNGERKTAGWESHRVLNSTKTIKSFYWFIGKQHIP